MSVVPAIPEDLTTDIKRQNCAVFIGAGLSVVAGYPKWDQLLTNLINRAKNKGFIDSKKKLELEIMMKTPSKWLMAAQDLIDSYGEGPFHSELAKIFDEVGAVPTDRHKAITEIDFSFVVTTNYDQLIENAYFPKFGKIPKFFTHQDKADFANSLWKQEFFILKAHGSIDKLSTIILTERDYRRLIYSSPGYRALLAAIFTTKTILFLGASLTDPEINLLLGSLHDSFQGEGQTHYALIPSTEFTETEGAVWRKNYNMRCLIYEPSSDHREVLTFLENLKAAAK